MKKIKNFQHIRYINLFFRNLKRIKGRAVVQILQYLRKAPLQNLESWYSFLIFWFHFLIFRCHFLIFRCLVSFFYFSVFGVIFLFFGVRCSVCTEKNDTFFFSVLSFRCAPKIIFDNFFLILECI